MADLSQLRESILHMPSDIALACVINIRNSRRIFKKPLVKLSAKKKVAKNKTLKKLLVALTEAEIQELIDAKQ